MPTTSRAKLVFLFRVTLFWLFNRIRYLVVPESVQGVDEGDLFFFLSSFQSSVETIRSATLLSRQQEGQKDGRKVAYHLSKA